jgi:hypothetical protein
VTDKLIATQPQAGFYSAGAGPLSLFMVSPFCDWPSACVYGRHESD